MHAQLVPDGGSRTLANVTNSVAGTITIGTNGVFTSLALVENSLLTNTAHGVIGRNVEANANEVRLSSSSARWLMGKSLFVLTATNIALPASNWVAVLTNGFDAGGGSSFANGLASAAAQRFFRLNTPRT